MCVSALPGPCLPGRLSAAGAGGEAWPVTCRWRVFALAADGRLLVWRAGQPCRLPVMCPAGLPRGPRAMPGAGRWLKNHPPRTQAHLLTVLGAGPGPRAPVKMNQVIRPGHDGRPGRLARGADPPPGATARRRPGRGPADASGRPCRIRAGTSRAARTRRAPGDRLAACRVWDIGLFGGQVGVGLRSSPRGAQLGVGVGGGGVPGYVPAVGRSGWVAAAIARHAARTCSSVRAGRSGGRDGVGVHAAASRAEHVIQAPRPRSRRGGFLVFSGGAGGGMITVGDGAVGRRQRGRFRPGDVDEGGAAAADVTRLPGVQGADQVGVGGPRVLDSGGAFLAPGRADELVRRFQYPAGSGQLDDRFGVGGVSSQMPPSAVAAIRYRSSSSRPNPCQDCADTCTPRPRDRPRSYRLEMGTRRDTAL